jgi:hypothetical protein
MLTKFLGVAIWSHRMIDVAQAGMWVLGYDSPRGLAATATDLRDCGFDIPDPNHTAEGDVRCTRAVYEALQALRARRA